MEYGTLERAVEIEASPETVFEVITSPEHLKEWWPDEAVLEPTPGFEGELVFGDRSSPEAHIPKVTVVEAVPPKLFSFRWVYPEDETAREGNSLLVTFELTPTGRGTRLRMTETGFREKGWEVAVLEEQYRDHEHGWDRFLPQLVTYAASVEVRS
ncbi:MAG: SRPBCC domain-containing protein [Actinomycetota bacterium]|nr:SRPBCC domain-containing protein [Actinomycetota bacterium]